MHTATQELQKASHYKHMQFEHWYSEYQATHEAHLAYIALNFGGILEMCKDKYEQIKARHASGAAAGVPKHKKALARLERTMSATAVHYGEQFKLARF